MVGVRDPAQAEAALGFGFEEAALRHARLLAVHAWSSPVPGHAEAPAEETSRLESAVTAWQEKFPEVEARWKWCTPTRAGCSPARPPAPTWSSSAGTRRAGPAVAASRSVTHAVLGHAHGPVVTVPGD